jgi:hypothetical protein
MSHKFIFHVLRDDPVFYGALVFRSTLPGTFSGSAMGLDNREFDLNFPALFWYEKSGYRLLFLGRTRMYTVIGSCSLCGGNVMGFTGPWFGVIPPRAYCANCGATEATNKTVIPMEMPGQIFEKGAANPSYESIDFDSYKLGNTFDTFFDSMDKIFDGIFGKNKGEKKEK